MHDTDRTLAELARLNGEVGETGFELLDDEDFDNAENFEFVPVSGMEMAYESGFEDEGEYEAGTFMPREEFRRRMRMHIAEGWEPILPHQEVPLYPVFSADFDKFAASAAHELRQFIVYRSDGGVFARGLVRANPDLQNIHKDLRDAKYPEGQKVRLAAALFRRRHADPTKRYMMSLQFAHTPIKMDVDVVHASPVVTEQSEKNLAERVLKWAERAGNDPRLSGDSKKRIADWAHLAHGLGYPRFLELWHYHRGLVARYVQPQYEGKRKEMTGGARPPFDGDWRGEPWRIYPFKVIMAECKRRAGVNDCYAYTVGQLKLSEQNILAMLNDVWREKVKLDFKNQSEPSQNYPTTGSAKAQYGDLAPFLQDLNKQFADVNSLMNTYTKYKQYKPDLWESF